MDERSLQGLISKLIPDEIESFLTQDGEQDTRAVALLKTAAGQAGGDADVEINAFLNGRGQLLETTRAAAARGASASSLIIDFLTKQLNLSPALARVIAPLLVKLLPAIGAAEKPKPRRKKPKPSSSKPAHHAKPKPSSTKPAHHAKPKPSASAKPKKPKGSNNKKPAGSKPKPRRRTMEIPMGEAGAGGQTPE